MPQSAIPPSRHAPIRQVWLNSCREEIIEPDLPIVDTHHHMPDQRGNRYLFQDLLADVGSGHKHHRDLRQRHRTDKRERQIRPDAAHRR